MKKSIVAISLVALSFGAFAAESHTNWQGSVDKLGDSFVVTDAKVAADIAKYASASAKLKLAAAFKDGQLTAAEIKESGISDHHFYTGYLSSSKNQTEYDKKLKEMNGGNNVDDNFVSNRDMKAHGSMLMNQVDGKIDFAVKGQDTKMQQAHNYYQGRMDNLANGLQQLGDYVANNNGGTTNPEPTPNPGTFLNENQKVYQLKDINGNVVPGLVGYEYSLGKTGEKVIGYDVVKNDMVFTDHNGNRFTIIGAGESYDKLQAGLKEAMNGRPDGSPEFGMDRPLSSEAITQIGEAVNKVNAKVDAVVSGLQNADWSSMGGNAAEVGQRVDTLVEGMKEAGSAIQSNTTAINNLGNAFQAQAAHTASEIARLNGRIDSLEKKTDKLKAGVAGANAIGSLTQYTGNGTHHVAVGLGGYEGASALAGGYTYAISQNTTVRVTVAYDSEGDFGYGASVGHSW